MSLHPDEKAELNDMMMMFTLNLIAHLFQFPEKKYIMLTIQSKYLTTFAQSFEGN